MKPRVAVLILSGLAGCNAGAGPEGNPPVEPRAFRMGLTTFPAGPGREAALRTWDYVKANADLIVLHYDGIGLPWEDLEQGVVPDWFGENFRLAAEMSRGRVVYAAITPLNTKRTGVAKDSSGGPFPAVLGPASFANPRLRLAFQNYARFVADTLKPRYLALVIETNVYALASPEDYAHLVSLYKETYRQLKLLDPSRSVFATFQLEFLHTSYQLPLLSDFDPENDLLALSTYPSSLGLRPADIPPNYLTSVRALSQRRFVISETGFGSEPYTGPGLSAPGSDALAREYLQWLLAQATSAEFLVWFLAADIPWISEQLAPDEESLRLFIFMGLSRSDFSDKAVTPLWRENLRRPLARLTRPEGPYELA